MRQHDITSLSIAISKLIQARKLLQNRLHQDVCSW